MIITVKNLQQQTFTIDFEPKKTVLELKAEIFKTRGNDYIVEKQKLIYAGVILDDDRTIDSYKVDEKKFIVVMLTRDVSGPSKQNQQKKEQVTATIDDNSALPAEKDTIINDSQSELGVRNIKQNEASIKETSPSKSNQSNVNSSDLVGVLANTSLQSRAESSLLMGDEYNRTVESMIEMGYGREMVERAMAASFNNPERAVEYLISGIPDQDDAFNTVPSGSTDLHSIIAEAAGSPADIRENSQILTGQPTTAVNAADPFEFLRCQPQFLQMRSLVYQNPDLLQAVLQQIGQTNPALLQLISENQDAFLNMLNQPLEGEPIDQTQANRLVTSGRRSQLESTVRSTAGNEFATNSERQESNSDPIGENLAAIETIDNTSESRSPADNSGIPTIHLTPQDQAAIGRLKDLGFPEPLVLQAYFACEKDEQLAANFLISSVFDD